MARITPGQQTCVLALDESENGAVTFIGSTSAILIGCNVHSNSLSDSSVLVTGNSVVRTPCVSASGMVSVSASLSLSECAAPYERADQVPDPYADLPVPDLTQPYTTPNTFGGGAGATYNVSPGRYQGMDIRRTVNMAPGVYVIDGGSLSINSTATVNGTGVTFYLTNGATVSMNGGADIHLSAPTSGDYSGVLMFMDRSENSSNVHQVNGNSSSRVNGAIYSANGKVRMNGTSTFGGGCTQIVARTDRVQRQCRPRRRLHRFRRARHPLVAPGHTGRMRQETAPMARCLRLWLDRGRLLRCDAGVAATEFAIFAPMIIFGLLTMVDIGGAIAERMEMDRNVRAGAQAAMSLNNDVSSIEEIILASTEEPENLTVAVNMQCLCSEASAVCTTPCPDATAPGVFVEISTQQAYDGIIIPERTLTSQTRVQIR